MKKITIKIQTLKKEIELKDKIIGALLHVISENKIKLPDNLIKIISILYYKTIIKEKETKQQEEIKPEIEKAIDNAIENNGENNGTEI